MGASAEPSLRALFSADVDVGGIETLGPMAMGERRVIAITGGVVSPARPDDPDNALFSGRVLALGEDWQWVRGDGITELLARYVLELASGERIEVEAQGYRHGPAEVLARIARGDAVDPAEYYFRTAVRMRTASARPALARLNGLVIVCAAERRARQVCLTYYEVA